MKEIQLTQGKVALVDNEDYEYLNQWKWHVIKGHNTFYAIRNFRIHKCKRSKIYMHRLIMNPNKGMVIDHIDRCGLNNQKKNLRICTKSQNSMNSCLRLNSTTKYKGVYYDKILNKFRARIYINKITKNIGSYIDPKDAARAYNEAAIKHFGKFAQLNKVD